MSSELTENPVLLWGDMGPDVYKLSQIYDPRNDRYVTTQDTSVKTGKEYYERLDMILTSDTVVKSDQKYYERKVDDVTGAVTYKLIKAPTGNPSAQGWYQNSGGKIKVFSLVTISEWAEEHGVPIEKVNPYLPYGTEGKEEKDWVHWYEVNEGSENTCGKYVPAVDSLVVVDETECYYKIENKYKTRMLLTVKSVDYALNVTFATVVFGTDTEETTRTIDYGNEKFMLFFNRRQGANTSDIVLTPDRKLMLYGKNSYAYRLKRDGAVISKIKSTIQYPDDALIPYSRAAGQRVNITKEVYDELYESKAILDVVLPTGLQRTITLSDYVPGTDAEYINTCDTTFRKDITYYAGPRKDTLQPTDYTVGQSILDWEKSDPEGRRVYRKIKDDLLGRTCFVMYEKPSLIPSGCVFIPESCYLKANCSIVEAEPILMEIFSFDYETNEANLIMTLTVTAKEATPLDMTDVTTRQIVKFDVELNGHEDTGDVWYLQQGDDWREVFSIVPKISFDDGSDLTVPIDNKVCYRYGFEDIKSTLPGREFHVLFKFFPHKSLHVDWQKFGLTPTKNYVSCRKTIKIVNNLAYNIRKISLIPAWDHDAQAYEFYFMIFRKDFVSPEIIRSNLDTKYLIETYKLTTDTKVISTKVYYQRMNSGHFMVRDLPVGSDIPAGTYERTLQPKTSLDEVQYMNANGDKQFVGATAAGGNFDIVQHAKLAEKVTVRGMNAESIYTQDVIFKLQNMMLMGDEASGLPYKWTIGDDHTTYEGETMPYGKVPKRPYLLYTFDHTEKITVDGVETDVIVGSYQVDKATFDSVGLFLDAFYYAAQPPRGVPDDHALDTTAIKPTHFFIRSVCDDSASTEFVEITEGTETYLSPVLMRGGGKANESGICGGAIPVQFKDPIYGQGTINLMGTVIVEFVHRYPDPDDATKYIYKHLYAVPVETRDTAWKKN